MESAGWQNLPEPLRYIGQLRLKHPEATLAELAQLSDPPVGRSGINHRLRKLVDLAAETAAPR
jgi:hypothetical protein